MDVKDAGIGSNKEVEAVLSTINSKINGVRSSLSAFIGKMEHEQLTWPSVLDNFSSFSGHTSNLMKQLSGERLPPLHTRVILPLMVSSDKDYELERQTEGRVPMMHHEVVPNYLRTKLSLDLESKQKERWEMCRKEGGAVSVEDIEKFNRVLSSALERVNGLKEKMDERKTRAEMTQSSLGETKKLVALYLHGVGLTQMSGTRRAQLSGGGGAGGVGGRMPTPSRNMAIRGAVRADQRMGMVAPYPTNSPHKQLQQQQK